MGISKRTFGVTKGGKETFLYTITNKNGMKSGSNKLRSNSDAADRAGCKGWKPRCCAGV